MQEKVLASGLTVASGTPMHFRGCGMARDMQPGRSETAASAGRRTRSLPTAGGFRGARPQDRDQALMFPSSAARFRAPHLQLWGARRKMPTWNLTCSMEAMLTRVLSALTKTACDFPSACLGRSVGRRTESSDFRVQAVQGAWRLQHRGIQRSGPKTCEAFCRAALAPVVEWCASLHGCDDMPLFHALLRNLLPEIWIDAFPEQTRSRLVQSFYPHTGLP